MTEPAPIPATEVSEAERVIALAALYRQTGREIESRVRGGSMGSSLPDGARIRIRCCDVAACQLGDVVVFTTGRGLAAHRMLAKSPANGYLITRGDAMLLCDPPVPHHLALGVVSQWSDGTEWQSPGAIERAGAGRRLLRALLAVPVVAAVRVRPGVARWLAGGMITLELAARRAIRRMLQAAAVRKGGV